MRTKIKKSVQTIAKRLKELLKEYHQPLKLTLKIADGSEQWIIVNRTGEFKVNIIECEPGKEYIWSAITVITKYVHLYEGGVLDVEFNTGETAGKTSFVILKMEN